MRLPAPLAEFRCGRIGHPWPSCLCGPRLREDQTALPSSPALLLVPEMDIKSRSRLPYLCSSGLSAPQSCSPAAIAASRPATRLNQNVEMTTKFGNATRDAAPKPNAVIRA